MHYRYQQLPETERKDERMNDQIRTVERYAVVYVRIVNDIRRLNAPVHSFGEMERAVNNLQKALKKCQTEPEPIASIGPFRNRIGN